MEAETTHKRRVRYKGTHPRTFEEKYKEHDPEKYADTVAKVIEKGSTPAGMHIPIMVKEILDFLQIQPGQKGLDATLGYGGHTRKMLEKLTEQSGSDCLNEVVQTMDASEEDHINGTVQSYGDSRENLEEVPNGHLYALDVDPIEIVKTRERLRKAGYGEEILTILQRNFANLETVAKEYGPFDFMLSMVCRFPRDSSSRRRQTAIIRIRFIFCPRSNTIQSHRIFIPVIPIFSRRIVRV